MTVSRDKLGEFILVSEAFNRYEEFAASAENFATVDEASPSATGQGAISLYKDTAASDERRLLVRSDRVYGEARRAAKFVFDLAFDDPEPTDFVWEHVTTQQANGAEKHGYVTEVTLAVRAILSEFDPAAITWADAYVTGGGLTLSDDALELCIERASSSVRAEACPPMNPTDPIHVTVRSFNTGGAFTDWNFCPETLSGLCDAWNSEAAIYGFEVRIVPSVWFSTDGMGTPVSLDSKALWLGDADAAVCYAIRK